MKTWTFKLRFLNPAFLGNADQTGQWRTPPIKALLRQWWRVAYAAEARFAFQVDDMRSVEEWLFGSAADAGSSNRSRLRIRLDCWNEGKLKSWAGLEAGKVGHPETEKTGWLVGPHAYLAYGPLDGRDGTTLKRGAAIQPDEVSILKLALMPDPAAPSCTERESQRIELALALMNRFGTLGGRSRNGWGSIELSPVDRTGTAPLAVALDLRVLRPWQSALKLDWPHAIGCSIGEVSEPLIWQTTETFADWKLAMRRLAEIKIGLRTQFVFPKRGGTWQPLGRHWLSYPVVSHPVGAWGDSARLPNSLRFRLRRDADDPTRLRAVIFHVPCLPPKKTFNPDLAAIVPVWQAVHGLLDELCKDPSSPRRYDTIADPARQSKLKPQLDGIRLQRVPS